MLRVEKARSEFHRMSFDERKCRDGLTRIGRYHEKKDKTTGQGLGPNHDENSHGGDAFGLSAVIYESPKPQVKLNFNTSGGWLSG
jgi:phage terminase large subunit